MIVAYYQEAIVPDKLENVVNEIQYLDGLVSFYAEQITKDVKGVEKIDGIKEDDVSLVIKPINKGVPVRFKRRDRVTVYGKVYEVLAVVETIPEKFRLKVSKNKALYERYVTRTLYLGV